MTWYSFCFSAFVAYCLVIMNTAEASDYPARQDVFVGGEGGYHTYRIPTIVVSSDSTVLAFCEGRRDSPADHGNVDLLLKRSTDEGKTWSDQIVIDDGGGEGQVTVGNPVPIVIKKTGEIRLLYTRDNKRLFQTFSRDDGKSWSRAEELTKILDGFDYPRVLVATGPVHGIETSSGRLIAPVWLSDREMDKRHMDSEKTRIRSGVIYSDDQGKTWQAGGLVPATLNRLHEATLAELSDGTILTNMRVRDENARALSSSHDGGQTWSKPAVDKHLPCSWCQAAMLVVPERGMLFLNSDSTRLDPKHEPSRRTMTLRLSKNEGRTWESSRTLYPAAAAYSDLAVTKDNKILCLFENGDEKYFERISLVTVTFDWLAEKDK